MRGTGVIPQNVPEHMEGSKRDPVGPGERWNDAPLYCKRRSPVPRLANILHPDAVPSVVPDTAVQFDGDGKLRIEVIPAPLPSEWLDQRSRMFVRQRRRAMVAVSGFLQGDSRPRDVFGEAEKIKIALIPEPRIKAGIDFMRETLQKHELDSIAG